MKFKLVLLVSLMILTVQVDNLSAQWELTNWPVGCCYQDLTPIAIGNDLFLGSPVGVNALGGLGGITHSTDFGKTWAVLNDSLHGPLAVIGTDLLALGFQGSGNECIFSSTDHGGTWRATKDSGLPPSFAFFGFTTMGSDLYAVIDNYSLDVVFQIYRSTDSGATWSNVSPDNVPQYNTLASLYVFGTRLLLVNQGRTISGIYSSSDSGSTWLEDVSNNSGSYPRTITSCLSDIFVAGYDGVYRSTDIGASWSQVASSSLQVSSFIVIDTNIYAATYGSGVSFSSDLGSSWSSFADGLPNGFSNFPMVVCGPFLFVVDDSFGVYRRPLSEFAAPEGVSTSLKQTQSLSIFPDPTSHETMISFFSDAASPANVTIFNLLGSEVARLFDGSLEAGNHSFTWDASTATSGSYFCVVRLNGQVLRMPIVVTK